MSFEVNLIWTIQLFLGWIKAKNYWSLTYPLKANLIQTFPRGFSSGFKVKKSLSQKYKWHSKIKVLVFLILKQYRKIDSSIEQNHYNWIEIVQIPDGLLYKATSACASKNCRLFHFKIVHNDNFFVLRVEITSLWR